MALMPVMGSYESSVLARRVTVSPDALLPLIGDEYMSYENHELYAVKGRSVEGVRRPH